MKRTIVFLMCMMGFIIALAQNRTQNLIQEIQCTPPQFTGIDKAVPILVENKFPTIEQYLINNVTYPEKDLRSLNEGTEILSFNVTTTGDLTNIKVINSVSPYIDAAVIAALENTKGMWKPGFNDDKPVMMEKEISLVFKINDIGINDFTVQARSYYVNGSRMFFNKSNPKKALKYLDKGIILLPNDKALLVMRGLTRFEIGNKEGAIRDWTRVRTLGGIESQGYLDNYSDLKGYAEMVGIIEK